MKEEILRIDSGFKEYQRKVLLKDFNLQIFKGELCGLIINNVKEKESVIEVLSGKTKLDYGWLYFEEQLCQAFSDVSTLKDKIFFIDGKSRLVDKLSVEDNVFTFQKNVKWYSSKKKYSEYGKDLLETYQLKISLRCRVSNLTILQKKKLELLKAYARGYRFITIVGIGALLSDADIINFFSLVNIFQRKGVAFLLIENNENILLQYADVIAILKKGRTIAQIKKRDFNRRDLYGILLGDALKRDTYSKNILEMSKEPQKILLNFEYVKTYACSNLNFKIHEGELVNFLDFDSTSYSGVIEALEGGFSVLEGDIWLAGKIFRPKGIWDAMEKGICFIGENPMESMLFHDLTVFENINISLSKKVLGVMFRKKYQRGVIEELKEVFSKEELDMPVHKADPITMQKLIYYRWILFNPKLLVCIRPFSAVDFHMRHITEQLIHKALEKKIAVLIVTSNMDEACYMGERVLVLKDGILFEDNSKNVNHAQDALMW
ncbi:sugar ABC transporter ATP-binding protein [Anaerosacchariphilus polymeriproducens]|nr:hypothetical protein [Anaerosacchariphilus polymeriproducens]